MNLYTSKLQERLIIAYLMASSVNKITRSTNGCRTCKRRRKKCDETQPQCKVCTRLGIECEGYTKTLVWGNGMASRGKFRGATLPILNDINSRNEKQRADSPRRDPELRFAADHAGSSQNTQSPSSSTSSHWQTNSTDDAASTRIDGLPEGGADPGLSEKLYRDCMYSNHCP